MIDIVGLGAGAAGLMTTGTWEVLSDAALIILRTSRHPSVAELDERGLQYVTCDNLYDSADDFSDVYAAIAKYVIDCAGKCEKLVYAVPGSPMVAEKTVQLIRTCAKEQNITVQVHAAVSFLDELFAQLNVDPLAHGLTIVDALDIWQLPATLGTPLVITQVYDMRTLSEAKLSLAESYGDEYEVIFAKNIGLMDEQLENTPIFELDRKYTANHLTSIFVPAKEFVKSKVDFSPIVDIMAQLRSPEGCIWDKEQTHGSLRRYIVEEVYEVLEAIGESDYDKLCDELGDLLLQIVFHSRIAEEQGGFSMQDVIEGITAKMIRRHPHVFSGMTVREVADVLVAWEQIKAQERATKSTVIGGVPKGLPALMYAQKIQEKVAKAGFDWPEIAPVWDKILEETIELKEALASGDAAHVEHEFGDLLFTIVNLGRFLGLESETALTESNRRFYNRFTFIERKLDEMNGNWTDIDVKTLDKWWEEAKIKVKKV